MLKTSAHFLGKAPTKTKRARIVRLVRMVGKTLPCVDCRTSWNQVITSFGGIYQFTGNSQLFFTFVFDLNIAWNLCHQIVSTQQWREDISKFHLMDRRADNMLVKLFPKLYNNVSDLVFEESVPEATETIPEATETIPEATETIPATSETCDTNACPNVCDHLIGPNAPCQICSILNWGIYFWEYFHTISVFSHLYTSQKNKAWLWKHILLVGSVVPCAECYLHWKNAMHILACHKKTITQSPVACFTFLFDLHDNWNKKLGKQDYTWSEAIQKYKGFEDGTPYDTTVWKTLAVKRSCLTTFFDF